MREVAVTEGDKVAAQIQFGFAVNGYGVGDLVKLVKESTDAEIDKLVKEYEGEYTLAADLKKDGAKRKSLREGARIELGLRAFLKAGNFKGFTTTFEDLHGLGAIAGPGGATVDGGRLRFRRRRRLEDLRAVAGDEGHGGGFDGRHVVHGRLHLSSGSARACRCWARTCWKFVRASRRASRRWKCIRWASAARRTRCGSFSTRRRAPA